MSCKACNPLGSLDLEKTSRINATKGEDKAQENEVGEEAQGKDEMEQLREKIEEEKAQENESKEDELEDVLDLRMES